MVIVLAVIFLLLVWPCQIFDCTVIHHCVFGGNYTVTMGCLQTIVLHVLHKPGVSWAVRFFVFLLLVALGVDYSMFLMARFEEEYLRGMSPSDAIREAMSKMGKVIFSAAAIMAGTFGSMIVAGVESLTEIGLSVVMGLILYAAVFLAFFIPASVRVVGRGHGWQFRIRENCRQALPETGGGIIPSLQDHFRPSTLIYWRRAIHRRRHFYAQISPTVE